MSWYYGNDDTWNDSDDSYADYYALRYISDEIYPLSYHPFRQLVDAAIGYMETQAEAPLRDSASLGFIDLAAGADGWLHWERELKFHKLLALPPELRLKVYGFYVRKERDTGYLQKHQHSNCYGNACCIWRWPSSLTLCDLEASRDALTAHHVHWLPRVAFVNKQFFGEVTIHMLKTTEWFKFLYINYQSFKILPWFTHFLSTFPANEAINAIKQIKFPHAYRYNKHRLGRVIDEQNPDIQFMLRCTMLESIAMTFDWCKLVVHNGSNWYDSAPCPLEDFLDFYQLRPMLQHKSVKKVYLVGLHPDNGEGDSLQCLEAFAKWIVKGFKEKQGRMVDVYMHKRYATLADVVNWTKMEFEDI